MSAELDAAIRYVERGWPVFPCSPKTGAPLNEHGFHEATTDADKVLARWKSTPNAAIGIATGGAISVLDVDHTDFATGVADLPDVITDGGPVARSGGGKWHLYFKGCGTGRRIRFSKWCDWLDGDGYVIAAPSRHKSGGTYSWFTPFELELHAPPPELLDLLRRPTAPVPAAPRMNRATDPDRRPNRRGGWSAAGLIGQLATAGDGERNQTLVWAAHRVGLDVRNQNATRAEGDDACQELERVALMIGLGDRETRRTITSGYGAGLAGRTGKHEVAA